MRTFTPAQKLVIAMAGGFCWGLVTEAAMERDARAHHDAMHAAARPRKRGTK